LETLLAHGFFDYVHFTAEQSGQMLFKVFEPAEIVKTATRKAFSQADRDIDVGGIGLSTGRGAKQGNTRYAKGAELLFMLPQGTYHLVAVHGFILPYLTSPIRAL
jgi:hypothetical protein